MSSRHVFFATCAPGIEPILFREAQELRLSRLEQQVGGVYFEGTLEDAWRANLWLRTAIRIFLRLARYAAKNSDELYAGAAEVDWTPFVTAEGTLIVDSQTKDSELFHTHFIQQRIKDAVVDQFRAATGVRPSVSIDDPDLRIHAHLFRDRVTLSVDTSGGSLHKRGWRKYQGRAPLSETLAAAVILMSGWDKRSPLIDPLCGSGTIAIEAAAIAGNVAPGRWRKFGFERWPGHDAQGFARLRREADAAVAFPRKLTLRASDRDRFQVAGARENIESAGFSDRIEVARVAVEKLDLRPGWNAWIVTNPPYGVRVGKEAEVAELHQTFGRLLRERCEGYTLAALCGSTQSARSLAGALGVDRPTLVPLQNGTLECELLRLRIGDDAPPAPAEVPRRKRRRHVPRSPQDS